MRTMPLGLACVAQAAAGAGHAVKMLDLVQVDDISSAIGQAIDRFAPDVVGISIRNIDDQAMGNTRFLYDDDRKVIALVRELTDRPIVLGGAGYSMFPAAILADTQADIGIEGEGEAALILVLDALQAGRALDGLPGVHVKGGGEAAARALIRQPDDFPLPDPVLMLGEAAARKDVWIPVQTRRGCPMDCSYCSTASIEGRIPRKRSIESVVDWIGRLRRLGIRQFYFVDNTFNLPPSYATELCNKMAGASLDIKWRCILYPHRVDETMVAAMAAAGCFEVSIGSESGSDEILKKLNKRFRRRDVEQASKLLKKHRIKQMGFLMLGAPGETRSSIEESLSFADSLELDMLNITIGVRIYPGTALASEALREGTIAPGDNLLEPRFYFTPGLDEEWVRETVARYAATRPNWIIG